jgi:hypothetical protein
MKQGNRSGWGKVAAVGVALLALCMPARAQVGMGGGDLTQFVTPVSKKSMNAWAQMVGMDKDQKDAALALLEGYQSQHKAMVEEMQKSFKEAQEKIQESGDWASMQKEMAAGGKKLTEKMEKLEKGFLGDVKSLLNEKQAENWPRVERARRRENGLRMGFMAGQNVDLEKMLANVQVTPDSNPELMDLVLRYEADMDRELQAFETWGKDQQAKQADMKPEDMMDPSKWTAVLKEMGDLAKKMKDVNRQYAKSMQAVLPAEKQAKFDLEVKRKSFPRVYREAYVEKAMSEADKFSDLTPEQKDSIASLRAGYVREAEGLNKDWASAIEAKEEKHGGSIGAMMSGMMGGGGGEKDEVKEARAARKELDDRTKERLLAVLKEDQKSRLPEDKPDRRDNGMNFGFDIDPPEVDDE